MTNNEIKLANQAAFLAAFELSGIISQACRDSGVTRTVLYRWRSDDEQFAKRFDESEQVAAENLIKEARRRAAEGYEEVVVSMGKIVMVDGQPLKQRKYSDQLLKFLIELRQGKPVQRVEHGGEAKKPKELAPQYVADILALLDRRDTSPAGEDSD